MHRDYVLYVTRHSPLALVRQVDVASCGRAYVGDHERRAQGYRPGKVRLVTDLCVFGLDPESRRLAVIETFPGVARSRIAEATGFPVRFASDCIELPPPDRALLRVLRERIDPFGLRRLEFVGARQRGALLDEIIGNDRAFIAGLGSGDAKPRRTGRSP
jgi:glutaconate CoA-transferase subunit A